MDSLQEVIKFFHNLPNRIPLKFLTDEFAEKYDNNFMALKSALEKQIPKKPEKKPDKYCDLVQIYYCPTCGRYFGQRGVHNAILFNKERFCQGENCGQALDWTTED